MAIPFLAAPIRTSAFSECKGDRKGYCVKLESPASQTARNNNSPYGAALMTLAAASDGFPFPGIEFLAPYGVVFHKQSNADDIGTLLSAIYNFGVVIAGISAFAMFIWAGILRLTARDNASQVTASWKYMTNSAVGLLLVVTSYLILYTINPDLTFKLKLPCINQDTNVKLPCKQ